MKRILTILLFISSITAYSQETTWTVHNDSLFMKRGVDSVYYSQYMFFDFIVWLKGIVINTQSLLDQKQATLSSGSNIKTINGNPVLGSGNLAVTGTQYTLSVQALTSSPADGQTIYLGNLPKAPTTTANISKIYIRQSGTIKRAEIYCYSGTAGTNEAWVMHIRKNNTTDTQIASVSLSASERVFSNTNLNISVVSGDYIEIKMVNPTWATNPLTTITAGYLYIE